MTMIETHVLTKAFKTRQGVVEAVRGVDLEVREGEIFGFLGPNGAGKTTTMRMLATLLPPTSGQAKVASYDLLREAAQVRKHIGYVSQTGGAEPYATAHENLVLQGRLYGMDKQAALTRANELIQALELESFAHRLVNSYSSGQHRRLDLAMGMMHRPALLFLDEPTTGLDPQSRARLWEEVKRLSASGTTIFLTTHYLDEADSLCDRLAIIDDGRIVREGSPLALKQQVAGDSIALGLDIHNGTVAQIKDLLQAQPFVREIHDMKNGVQLYVERGDEALPTVMRMLDSAHVPIQTVTLARPSLDDVFLHFTGRSLRESSNAA